MAGKKFPFPYTYEVINISQFLQLGVELTKICQDLEISFNQTQFKLYTEQDLDRIFMCRASYPNLRQSDVTLS